MLVIIKNLTLLGNIYSKNKYKIWKKDTGLVSYKIQFDFPDGVFD